MPILPNVAIAVDHWRLGDSRFIEHYFLTHVHTDHLSGLSARWGGGKLFCSNQSKDLLLCKFQVAEKDCPWIHTFHTGRPFTIRIKRHGKEIYQHGREDHVVTVTAFNAHHVPGSVMYLFEGEFGCYFYTGDFRIERAIPSELQCLANKSIDIMWVDNTFATKKFQFPPRSVLIKAIVGMVKRHDGCTVILSSDTIGKESLYSAISKELKKPLVTAKGRFNMMGVLGLQEYFTLNRESSNIVLLSRKGTSRLNLNALNKLIPTIVIEMTGLVLSSEREEKEDSLPNVLTSACNCPVPACFTSVHRVPYSNHSDFHEICRLVAFCKPKALLPVERDRCSLKEVVQSVGLPRISLTPPVHGTATRQRQDTAVASMVRDARADKPPKAFLEAPEDPDVPIGVWKLSRLCGVMFGSHMIPLDPDRNPQFANAKERAKYGPAIEERFPPPSRRDLRLSATDEEGKSGKEKVIKEEEEEEKNAPEEKSTTDVQEQKEHKDGDASKQLQDDHEKDSASREEQEQEEEVASKAEEEDETGKMNSAVLQPRSQQSVAVHGPRASEPLKQEQVSPAIGVTVGAAASSSGNSLLSPFLQPSELADRIYSSFVGCRGSDKTPSPRSGDPQVSLSYARIPTKVGDAAVQKPAAKTTQNVAEDGSGLLPRAEPGREQAAVVPTCGLGSLDKVAEKKHLPGIADATSGEAVRSEEEYFTNPVPGVQSGEAVAKAITQYARVSEDDKNLALRRKDDEQKNVQYVEDKVPQSAPRPVKARAHNSTASPFSFAARPPDEIVISSSLKRAPPSPIKSTLRAPAKRKKKMRNRVLVTAALEWAQKQGERLSQAARLHGV